MSGNTNGEKVAAIIQAWFDHAGFMAESVPLTHESGPAVNLDLMAQIAINVLTDWHKR